MEKVGGGGFAGTYGEVHKFPLQNSKSFILVLVSLIMYCVVIDQIIGLHCIEVSSYDCCH